MNKYSHVAESLSLRSDHRKCSSFCQKLHCYFSKCEKLIDVIILWYISYVLCYKCTVGSACFTVQSSVFIEQNRIEQDFLPHSSRVVLIVSVVTCETNRERLQAL